MKISGFTLVRNGVQFDYPFIESLRSLLPLVDELVINVGIGDDPTLARIQNFAQEEGGGKVVWFESTWPLDDPQKRRGGRILSEQTNLALDRCTGDWCIYLQADEVLHQADIPRIRQAFGQYLSAPYIEGLLFDWVHFYGSYDIEQYTRKAYWREVRAFKRSCGARSVGDAQSFRKPDDSKLQVARIGARVFHYGWVRTPDAMKEKTFFMDQLYHGKASAEQEQNRTPHTGDNYLYKRFWGLRRYRGSHPLVMRERIREKNWKWDFENSPVGRSLKDVKTIALDLFERLTGKRLFEYRSYRLIETMKPQTLGDRSESRPNPVASVILSTYEMPRYLERVLEGFEQQSFQNFEVVLCDDGSGEETRALVEKFKSSAPFPLIHLWQENKGFRKCRILNEGIRQARGELLIFVDGDCVPHRHFVADHIERFEHGTYQAGRRMELGPRLSEWFLKREFKNGYWNFLRPRAIWSFLSGDSEHFQRTYRVRSPFLRKLLKMDRVDDLKGCNFSASKEDLIRINGFDQAYEGYGREDTDVEIRLQNLGLEIRSLKGAALQFHLWHPRREFTASNDSRLEEVRQTGRYRCDAGLSG